MKKNSYYLLLSLLMSISACSSPRHYQPKIQDNSLRGVILDLSRENSRIFPHGRPVRLAVLTFMPTGKREKTSNSFGHYIAESLMSNIKKYNSKIRLFERARLGALLKEHSLALSGLVSRSQAKKIGQLAPIDFIVTGTYTVFSKRVEINGRAIDVVSGEIIHTFSRSVLLDADSRKYFDNNWISPHPRDDPALLCKKKTEDMMALLADLSTPGKIDNVVTAAVNEPFENQCAEVHFKVIIFFEKYKIYNKRYTSFLNNTLRSIKNPYADRRAGRILSYYNSRGFLSPEQWKAGIAVVRRNNDSYISSYLTYLFFPPGVKATPVDLQRKRIDRYMSMAQRGEIGLPMPVSYEKAFYEMLGGLVSYSRRRNVPLAVYAYDRYHSQQKTPDRIRLYGQLKNMYRYSRDIKDKKQVLLWICSNFNESKTEKQLGRNMMDFARLLVYPSKSKKSTKTERKLAADHFTLYKKLCQKKLAEALPAIKSENIRRTRAIFCIEHDIYAPELVPPVNNLRKQLDGENASVMKALFLLEKMGGRAKAAERELVRLLVKTEKKTINNPVQIRNSCFKIFVNIKSRNSAALRIVHRHAIKGGPTAVKTAVKLGKPIVPYLIKSLRSRDYYTKIQAAVIIKEMGDEARQAMPELKRQRRKSRNQRLIDEIDEALARMQ